MPVNSVQEQVINHPVGVLGAEMKSTTGILSLLLGCYLGVNLLSQPAEPVGPDSHDLRYGDHLSSALPWEQGEVKAQDEGMCAV